MDGLRCCSTVLAAALLTVLAPASDNNFTFVILGDRTGDAVPGIYEAIWRDTAALHPDFVINVGDTIQGLRDATVEAEWAALRPIWQQYHTPFFFTPGNHDILISQDRRTMPGHFVRFTAAARSPGVVLLREATPISTAIEELVLIWSASEAEEWIGRLVWIPL